jgi:hypothetical protein
MVHFARGSGERRSIPRIADPDRLPGRRFLARAPILFSSPRKIINGIAVIEQNQERSFAL